MFERKSALQLKRRSIAILSGDPVAQFASDDALADAEWAGLELPAETQRGRSR